MKRIVTLFALIACAALPVLAATVRPVQGNVIMAKASAAQALYVWNATPYVKQLVGDKLLGDDGLHAIEATAASLLVEKAKTAVAKSLSVRVLYEKTGAVSPVYGTPTFMGMEDVATLTAERATALKSGAGWAAQVQGGKVPSGLAIAVTGKLPPPQ